MIDFAGKGVVVTGGASGIGLATASIFGRKGARVVIADIDRAALGPALDHLEQEGTEAHGMPCDVAKRTDVEALADWSFEVLGNVHVVFSNAGVGVAGLIADMTHDDWRWVIDVDLWGPIHGVEAFVPRLLAQGEGGHLLFTSSFAGLVPNIGLGPYCVAKYGVVALAEVLRRELRDEGIGVSVLCPMRVATQIERSQRGRGPEYGTRRSGEVAEQMGDVRPLTGRVLAVEQVAEMTVAAVEANRLYVLPHPESRESIRRRFAQIDRTFEEQEA